MTIQPNELRITNWVNMDGEPYFIRAGEQIDDYCDRMEGMPITEGILRSCGITHAVDNKSVLYFTKDKYIDLINMAYDLKYVHQLQNLYFSLVGQELNIKL